MSSDARDDKCRERRRVDFVISTSPSSTSVSHSEMRGVTDYGSASRVLGLPDQRACKLGSHGVPSRKAKSPDGITHQLSVVSRLRHGADVVESAPAGDWQADTVAGLAHARRPASGRRVSLGGQ